MGIIKEENWTGNAEALAKLVKFWLRKKDIVDKSFEPNERLVRDYVAKNILSRPERLGKEAGRRVWKKRAGLGSSICGGR